MEIKRAKIQLKQIIGLDDLNANFIFKLRKYYVLSEYRSLK